MLSRLLAPASPLMGPLEPHPAPVSPLRAHLSRRSQQGFAHQPQIDQRKQDVELRAVLGQASIGRLAVAKLAFEYPCRVSDDSLTGRRRGLLLAREVMLELKRCI